MKDLAVCISNDNKNVSPIQTIDAIKNAGFKNVFVQWYNKDFNPDQKTQLDYARSKGLNVIFAHLGYQNINSIWLDGTDGDKLTERYLSDLNICKENDINHVVMHLTSKSEAPQASLIGLNRIKKICDYAEELKITVSFENTKIKSYQEYIIENIPNKNVGVCIDVGHLHAHFNDELDFSIFKDRIFAVHLHDNDGTKDQHYLPFDGTINWNDIASKLNANNYNGPITLELCYSDKYFDLSIEEYYKKAYKIGLKLQNIFETK